MSGSFLCRPPPCPNRISGRVPAAPSGVHSTPGSSPRSKSCSRTPRDEVSERKRIAVNAFRDACFGHSLGRAREGAPICHSVDRSHLLSSRRAQRGEFIPHLPGHQLNTRPDRRLHRRRCDRSALGSPGTQLSRDRGCAGKATTPWSPLGRRLAFHPRIGLILSRCCGYINTDSSASGTLGGLERGMLVYGNPDLLDALAAQIRERAQACVITCPPGCFIATPRSGSPLLLTSAARRSVSKPRRPARLLPGCCRVGRGRTGVLAHSRTCRKMIQQPCSNPEPSTALAQCPGEGAAHHEGPDPRARYAPSSSWRASELTLTTPRTGRTRFVSQGLFHDPGQAIERVALNVKVSRYGDLGEQETGDY
jgi:hypothetical protein